MQRDDESLQKYWQRNDVVLRGQAEISFEVKGGVLYRVYKHPYVNSGKPLKQVMAPVQRSDNGTSSRMDHGKSHGNKAHSIGQVFKGT